MPKYLNRDKDGSSYYYKKGVLYGCPTLVGGIPDYDAETPVEDYAEPLSEEEISQIKECLKICR